MTSADQRKFISEQPGWLGYFYICSHPYEKDYIKIGISKGGMVGVEQRIKAHQGILQTPCDVLLTTPAFAPNALESRVLRGFASYVVRGEVLKRGCLSPLIQKVMFGWRWTITSDAAENSQKARDCLVIKEAA